MPRRQSRDEELVVITKTYDLILWSCRHTGRFPRNHRFVHGERIERTLYGLLNRSSALATTRRGSPCSKRPTPRSRSSASRCGWRRICNA